MPRSSQPVLRDQRGSVAALRITRGTLWVGQDRRAEPLLRGLEHWGHIAPGPHGPPEYFVAQGRDPREQSPVHAQGPHQQGQAVLEEVGRIRLAGLEQRRQGRQVTRRGRDAANSAGYPMGCSEACFQVAGVSRRCKVGNARDRNYQLMTRMLGLTSACSRLSMKCRVPVVEEGHDPQAPW